MSAISTRPRPSPLHSGKSQATPSEVFMHYSGCPMPGETENDFNLYLTWRDSGEMYASNLATEFFWVERARAWTEIALQTQRRLALRRMEEVAASANGAALDSLVKIVKGRVEAVADCNEPVLIDLNMDIIERGLKSLRVLQEISAKAIVRDPPGNTFLTQNNINLGDPDPKIADKRRIRLEEMMGNQ